MERIDDLPKQQNLICVEKTYHATSVQIKDKISCLHTVFQDLFRYLLKFASV